jgi:hypothetical protein
MRTLCGIDISDDEYQDIDPVKLTLDQANDLIDSTESIDELASALDEARGDILAGKDKRRFILLVIK